jgi:hypothetical protein
MPTEPTHRIGDARYRTPGTAAVEARNAAFAGGRAARRRAFEDVWYWVLVLVCETQVERLLEL